ncbi:MAG: S9 family peptidase [Pseudomonadota bacterium]
MLEICERDLPRRDGGNAVPQATGVLFHAGPIVLLLGALLMLTLAPRPTLANTSVTPETYAQLPILNEPSLSPGGQFLAARLNLQNEYRLAVFDVTQEKIQLVYGFTEDNELSVAWFEWVAPDRLLISVGFSAKRGSVRKVKTTERRLLTVALPSGEVTPLFYPRRDRLPVQIQDHVVSYLPDDPDHILVQYPENDPARPNVYKLNVAKRGGHRTVMKGRTGVTSWRADREGDIRIGRGVKASDTPNLIVRLKGERKWRDFSHRVAADQPEFYTAGFTAEPNVIYVLSNHEGDPRGLYTFDLETDTFGPLIFRHDNVDIGGVAIDSETGELRSVSFLDDDIETQWFSKRPIDLAIQKLLPQFPGKSVTTYSMTEDAQQAVLYVAGDNDPGQFAVYNHAAQRLRVMPRQYAGLTDDMLAKTIVTQYEARDGLTIPTYVTLPTGLDSLADLENSPFIINPHGGPASRDFLRFSFDTQYLASLGYGVLQMNFRGSSGYGQEFRQAGQKEWGQAMQDDITDGVQWLIDNGYADPKRIAIVGGSYGGYAALMGVVKTPKLYRCAVSFAGVSDLPDLVRLQSNYVNGAYATRFIGDLWKDRKMLAENSPARRADEIAVPVLLIHGAKDTVVDVAQSKKMAKQLKRYKRTFEYIELPFGDHHHSLYEDRLRYLTETARFLDECM